MRLHLVALLLVPSLSVGCGSRLDLGDTPKPGPCVDCADAENGAHTDPNAPPPSDSPNAPAGPKPGGIFPSGPWIEAATGLDGGHVWSLAYDPNDAKVACAATIGGGIFKSVDGAATWVASSSGLGENVCVRQIYVHPGSTSTLFASAATCDRRVSYASPGRFDLFRSVDGGATWTKATPPGVADPRLDLTIFASKASADIVYLRSGSSLWKSVDRGVTFAPRSVPSSRSFMGAVVDPLQADVVYASLDVGPTVPTRTVRSPDGGVTWTDVAVPSNHQTTKLWFSPAEHTLWASMIPWSASPELWASKDDGATWQQRLGQRACVFDILALAPSNAKRLYSVSGHSVCRTDDQGVAVQTAETLQISGAVATDMAVSPANAEEWLLASAELHRSLDGGTTLTESQAGITNRDVEALALAPSNEQVLYAGGRGRVFRSIDAAKTWTRRGSGLPIGFDVTALAVHPLDENIVYAGAMGREVNIVAYVYKSVDGGSTFQKLSTGPLSRVDQITVDATNASHVTVLSGYRLSVSTNDGLTWGELQSAAALPSTRFVVHPMQPSQVAIVQATTGNLDPNSMVASRSTDGGLTFDSWTVPAKTTDIAFDATAPSTMYACTPDGPKVSIDSGISWSLALVGLVSQGPSPIECRRLFQTRTGQRIYMTDNEGALWLTKDGAKSWVRTKGIATLPGGQPLATFGGEPGIAAVLANGSNPDVVYLGLRSSVGVAKSTTGGL